MTFKKFPCLLLLATVFLTSCKKELVPQDSSTDTTAIKTAAVDPVAVAPSAIKPLQNGQPVQSVSAPAPATTTSVPPTAKGMNPPHGQPNHRCDIAVGAPLNSPVTKPAQSAPAPTMVAAPVTPSTIQPADPVTGMPSGTPTAIGAKPTPAGMNPPHGQEGHVCSVAVGAPLPK